MVDLGFSKSEKARAYEGLFAACNNASLIFRELYRRPVAAANDFLLLDFYNLVPDELRKIIILDKNLFIGKVSKFLNSPFSLSHSFSLSEGKMRNLQTN